MKETNTYTVDSYFIGRSHSAWSSCDSVCWYAKNLYNYANYIVRQSYCKKDGHSKYLNYYTVQKMLQNSKVECYTQLNSKVAQAVLRELDQNWQSFFKAKSAYWKDKSKFQGAPKPPKYKDTKHGRSTATFNIQAISKKYLGRNLLKLAGLDFSLPLRLTESIDLDGVVTYVQKPNLKEVSIVPKDYGYFIIAKYPDQTHAVAMPKGHSAGIDLGVNNLAAVATNSKTSPSFLINGRPLKAMNTYFNKHLAELRSQLDLTTTKRGKKRLSQKIQKLCRKRGFKVKHYLHEVTKMLVIQLADSGVSHLVVGKNPGWKQEISIGKVNNQNFVNIPHAKFIDMLQYKWTRAGGTFETTEESYTSKCSFLDSEEIRKHETYLGTRVNRGLFVSSSGHRINADINGAGNILRKVIKNAWSDWTESDLIQGFVVSPRRLTASSLLRK